MTESNADMRKVLDDYGSDFENALKSFISSQMQRTIRDKRLPSGFESAMMCRELATNIAKLMCVEAHGCVLMKSKGGDAGYDPYELLRVVRNEALKTINDGFDDAIQTLEENKPNETRRMAAIVEQDLRDGKLAAVLSPEQIAELEDALASLRA